MNQNSVEQAAKKLGMAIAEAPAVVSFQKAQEALKADEQMVQLLQKQAEIQTRIQGAQGSGNIAVSDLEELAAIHKTVQERMDDYRAAQEDLRSFVRQLNVEINQRLQFNFSSLARKSGCCG